jgi:Secretion system C-terminal sorting domain
MQSFYAKIFKPILFTASLLSFTISANAQLVPGDIAFSGYNSQGTDRFSFVLLKNLAAGATIKFTDGGWNANNNTFGATEGDITWTVPAGGLIAGREITIDVAANTATLYGAGNPGTVTGTLINFNTSGDQLFAYLGTLAAPTSVIAGLQMNVTATALGDCANTTDALWDWNGGVPAICPNPPATTSSHKPSGGGNLTLTTGVNALWIGTVNASNPFTTEWDNARFNCSSVPAANLATVALLRAALNDKANWTLTDNLNPSAFIPPAGCLWLGLAPLPVKLESFTGKLNSDKTILLQWSVTEQQDIKEYAIERSTDGTSFSTLVGTVAPGNTQTYSMLDSRPATGKNYYRLKTTELSGKITYSNVIVINLKAGIVISLYPNPVKDKLTIQQFGTIQNKTAILADQQGKVLQTIKLINLQQTVNMERYAAGIYVLKLDNGTSYKIVKE